MTHGGVAGLFFTGGPSSFTTAFERLESPGEVSCGARSFPFMIACYACECWLARGYLLRRKTRILRGIKSKRKQLFAGRIE